MLGDFFQVPKDWELGLETIEDGFFYILVKNLRLGSFIENSWRCSYYHSDFS
jgi:hypothetical protein